MKFASIEEMEKCLNAAANDPELYTEEHMEQWIQASNLAKKACEAYGKLLAEVFDLRCGKASWLEDELCCRILEKQKGQWKHPALQQLDPEGEWEPAADPPKNGKFEKGDLVVSSRASRDRECFGKVWHAVILEVKNPPKSAPYDQHQGCYETLGWYGEDRSSPPTLRQLWGVHLDADKSKHRATELKGYAK